MIDKTVIILGGGTAGLISALMTREKYPHTHIVIIKSKEIGIIGVGEGSTEHWRMFMDYVNIKKNELIAQTDATIKIGILFSNWNGDGKEYVHSIVTDHNFTGLNRIDLLKMLHCNSTKKFKTSPYFEETFYKNNIPIDANLNPSNQYHFDTFKLNEFLLRECRRRNIGVVDTNIVDVNLNEDGSIKEVVAEDTRVYEGDFFIDCSGFKRVLSNKLGLKWKSYTDYLPLNRAIAFPTEHKTDNYEPYTLSASMENGWLWRIPTQQRYGNGYVFSDQFTDSDKAMNEASKYLGVNLEKVARDIKFEAGKLEKFWHKNMLSVGLSGSFCEPLEAQSIGFTIMQSFAFVDSLEQWFYNKEYVEKAYNRIMDDSYQNVVDYLQLHYFCQRKDTDFWNNVEMKTTEFNAETYNIFANGYCDPFLFEDKKYWMFKAMNFFQVYSGLELIDTAKMTANFSNNLDNYNKELFDRVQLYNDKMVTPLMIRHSDAMRSIKQYHANNKHLNNV